MHILSDLSTPEHVYDWFCTRAFAVVVIISIAAGVIFRAFLEGTYIATLTAYAAFSILTVVRFGGCLRDVMLGTNRSRTFWPFVLLSALLGAAMSALQLMPSHFCTFGCSVDTMGLTKWPLAFAVIALAPFVETLLFFGAFQTFIARLLGKTAALFLSVALFCLAHGQFSPYVMAMGAMMALMRMRSMPLLPILAMHTAANALTYGFMFGS